MKLHITHMLFPLLLLGLLSFMSCASTQGTEALPRQEDVPPWMLDIYSVFPEDEYIAATEYGSSERDARNLAAGALARRFNLNVESNVEVQERIDQITDSSGFYAEEQTTSLRTVNTGTGTINFANLQYSDTFTDSDGRIHVVAYLNRSETGRIYRNRIQKDAQLISSLVTRSRSAESVLVKFALLDTALVISRNADSMIRLLEIIHPGMASMAASEINSSRLLELRDEATSEISYRSAIVGDSDGKVEGIAGTVLSRFGINPSPSGILVLTVNILMEEVQVNPEFKSVRWTLSADLADENGVSIVNLYKESRENAISVAEAEAFALRAVEKTLNEDFGRKFTAWIDSVSLGN